jgi:hypothetical protein
MAIQEDATSQCISPEKLVEVAHALQPMSDEVAFELDMLNDQGLAKRDGPPPDGGTGPGPQPGDDLLEKIIWEKLKIFEFLVGKIAGPAAEAFVKQFVQNNRDMITQALKGGFLAVLNLLKNLVGGFLGSLGK